MIAENEVKLDEPIAEGKTKSNPYSAFSINVDAQGGVLPTSSLPADVTNFAMTSSTIADNSNVTLSVSPGTNTDTVVAHGLGKTPKVITICALVSADGNTNDQKASGIVFYDSNGGVLGGFYTQVDQIGTLGSSTLLLQSGSNITATGTGGARATITVSVVSVDATNFTFRINGISVGTPPGVSTVLNIVWKAEG